MTATAAPPPLAALERLASRAAGATPPDLVRPLVPTLYEPPLDATLTPEEGRDASDVRVAIRAPQHAGDLDRHGQPQQPRRFAHAEPVQPPSEIAPWAASRAPAVADRPAIRRDASESQDPIPVVRERNGDAPTAASRLEPQTAAVPFAAVPTRGKPREPIAAPVIRAATPPPLDRAGARGAQPVRPSAPSIMVTRHVAAIEPVRRRGDDAPLRAAASQPVVHVTIGRVEIRTAAPSRTPEPQPHGRAVARESGLDRYLQRRGLGGRS